MSQFTYKIAAEYEAEYEDEDACAEDHDIDIERKVLEGDGWHSAGLIGVNQSQTTEAPVAPLERVHQSSRAAPLDEGMCVYKQRDDALCLSVALSGHAAHLASSD